MIAGTSDNQANRSQDSGARFQIVDAGSTRSDLAARKEVKYTLPHADVGKLRSLLEGNCRRLIHNASVSTVRSIYFDDPLLSACRANLDGIGRRRKMRLRWYDAPRPETDFVFEIKWRDNRVTGKHRVHVRSAEPLWQLSYPRIMKGLHAILPDAYRADLLRFFDPVLVVQYQREHFATDDGCLRVTLDYDVTYYDQLGKPFIVTEFGQRHHGLVVLEGKTPIGREAELGRLFYPFAPRIARCSKYVHGCRLLGHIGGAE